LFYMRKIKDNSLYLIITEEYGCGKGAVEIAEKAIAGGVDIIQMRQKNRPSGELIKLGKVLSRLCKKNGTLFIVNDDPLIASEVDADGVHMGQEDMAQRPIDEVRKIIGDGRIIGISTHSIEQFAAASALGADYMAFGPIFPTKTKNYFLGTSDIGHVASMAAKPVFFIGGINLSNIGEVLDRGAKNIAVMRAISEAGDITMAAREFKNRLIQKQDKVNI